MDGTVTYVHPKQQLSFTTHPSGPFDLIDTTSDETDYGKEVDAAARKYVAAATELQKTMCKVPGELDIRLESLGNTSDWYGRINSEYKILWLMALSTTHKASVSFRTKREAMTAAFELMSELIDALDEDQRPECWEELSSLNGVEVDFWSNEEEIEYRLAALALRLINDSRWCFVRDSDDKNFDMWGNVAIPSNVDRREELLSGSNQRCAACGKKLSEIAHYVQINKYTILCGHCIDSAKSIIDGGENAYVVHPFKSLRLRTKEAVEKAWDIILKR